MCLTFVCQDPGNGRCCYCDVGAALPTCRACFSHFPKAETMRSFRALPIFSAENEPNEQTTLRWKKWNKEVRSKMIMRLQSPYRQKRYVVSSRPVFWEKSQNADHKFKDFVRWQKYKISIQKSTRYAGILCFLSVVDFSYNKDGAPCRWASKKTPAGRFCKARCICEDDYLLFSPSKHALCWEGARSFDESGICRSIGFNGIDRFSDLFGISYVF